MTEVTVTAVHPVATKPIANSGAWPTDVTSKAPRDDSIIETVSGRIGGAVCGRKKG